MKVSNKGHLTNIRSKYILMHILNNLELKKTLDLFKYNKKLQKKLKVNLNDYKKCSEEIEILIEPLKTLEKESNKFINIENLNELAYFHIFFDDCKEGEKRNFLKKNETISKIKIIIDNKVSSLKGLL